jgi:isopentenyl-diphosphate delta-isomerase
VVLLDEQGHAVGSAPKRDVHTDTTPLHLAFSCYVFDHGGRLLLTRRALHKPTWPGAWTNSYCGHPGPGEVLADALTRRAEQELGVRLTGLSLALPAFRYQAVMANGVRENEMCPVFTALTEERVEADPEEVADALWVDWATFREDVLAGRREVSPWCVEQVALLPVEPPRGRQDDRAAWSALPPAARGPV